MANLFDYIEWRGDLTFEQAPFNNVDNLILSCLGYVVLDELVSGFECCYTTTVAEAASLFVQLPESVKNLRNEKDEDVLVEMAKTKRFGNLELLYHVDQTDRITQKQFAAITVNLGNGSHYVVYRGTDHTVIGWKEDFNMTFCSAVPAQLEAVAYLQKMAECTEGPLYVGGHSKGGNLAIYAGTNGPKEIQKRIRRIYSFDGPGFQKSFYENRGFVRIQDRYCKIVPEESLVGMLFANYRNYRIVESYRTGFGQHDLLQWKIRNGRFMYRKDLNRKSKRQAAIFNAWFNSLSGEQVFVFVETLYDLLCAAHVQSVAQLLKAPFGILRKMASGFRKLDKGKRGIIWGSMRKLVSTVLAFIKPGKK